MISFIFKNLTNLHRLHLTMRALCSFVILTLMSVLDVDAAPLNGRVMEAKINSLQANIQSLMTNGELSGEERSSRALNLYSQGATLLGQVADAHQNGEGVVDAGNIGSTDDFGAVLRATLDGLEGQLPKNLRTVGQIGRVRDAIDKMENPLAPANDNNAGNSGAIYEQADAGALDSAASPSSLPAYDKVTQAQMKPGDGNTTFGEAMRRPIPNIPVSNDNDNNIAPGNTPVAGVRPIGNLNSTGIPTQPGQRVSPVQRGNPNTPVLRSRPIPRSNLNDNDATTSQPRRRPALRRIPGSKDVIGNSGNVSSSSQPTTTGNNPFQMPRPRPRANDPSSGLGVTQNREAGVAIPRQNPRFRNPIVRSNDNDNDDDDNSDEDGKRGAKERKIAANKKVKDQNNNQDDSLQNELQRRLAERRRLEEEKKKEKDDDKKH